MTLNNLLSAPTRWNPIVPDRRHSMPSTPQSSTAQQTHIESSSSALQTLVSNLRNQDVGEIMVEAHQSTTDSDLIQELRVRVQTSSLSLESRDALLADALVSLLSYFQRLSAIQNTPSALLRPHDIDSWNLNNAAAPADIFDTLKRQLSDLQVERLSSQPDILAPGVPPVLAVEAALLWSRIDEVLEAVVSMCKERTESLPRFSMDHLPPQYDPEGYHFDTPPEYESGARKSVEDKKSSQLHAHQSPISAGAQPNEKMRLDLEAVAMAIDRLYLVAPQLHNQRVELKSSKLAQMERARQEGVQSSSRLAAHGKQKEKEADVRELENILDLLGKASERTMKDQSYVVEGGMRTRVERTRLRELAQVSLFLRLSPSYIDSNPAGSFCRTTGQAFQRGPITWSRCCVTPSDQRPRNTSHSSRVYSRGTTCSFCPSRGSKGPSQLARICERIPAATYCPARTSAASNSDAEAQEEKPR